MGSGRTVDACSSVTLSALALLDLPPSTVRTTTGYAPHSLRATINPHAMHKVAASSRAAVVVILCDNFTVTTVVRILPADWLARWPTLPGIVFRLRRKFTIARVERLPDVVPRDASDHGTREGCGDIAAAPPKLAANGPTSYCTNNGAPLLIARATSHN